MIGRSNCVNLSLQHGNCTSRSPREPISHCGLMSVIAATVAFCGGKDQPSLTRHTLIVYWSSPSKHDSRLVRYLETKPCRIGLRISRWFITDVLIQICGILFYLAYLDQSVIHEQVWKLWIRIEFKTNEPFLISPHFFIRIRYLLIQRLSTPPVITVFMFGMVFF